MSSTIADAPLITIEGCEASHLVGEHAAHLASGPLSLFYDKSSSVHPIPLTLTIGHAAFSLYSDSSSFFTHASSVRLYFFSLPLGADHHRSDVGSGSYIRLKLPEGITEPGSALEKQRDAFEDVLIKYGFLKAGVEAAGDELGKSVKQNASKAAENVRARTSKHISSADRAISPTSPSFAPTTHSFVAGATTSASSAISYTGLAASTLANVSIAVGERVVGLFGGLPKDIISPSPPPLVGHDAPVRIDEDADADWASGDEGPESKAQTPRLPARDVRVEEKGAESVHTLLKDTVENPTSDIGESASDLASTIIESAQPAIEHTETAALVSPINSVVVDSGEDVNNIIVGTSSLVLDDHATQTVSNADADPEVEQPILEPEQKDGGGEEESGKNPIELKPSGSLEDVPL